MSRKKVAEYRYGMEENMREIIIKRLGCTPERAESIEKNLKELSEPLRPLLDAWLEQGIEDDDTMYSGYSLNSLMRDYDMKFTGALLTLDWLVKEPKEAAKALKSGIR